MKTKEQVIEMRQSIIRDFSLIINEKEFKTLTELEKNSIFCSTASSLNIIDFVLSNTETDLSKIADSNYDYLLSLIEEGERNTSLK